MRELEPRCSQCGEPGATFDEAHGDYRCFAYRACWERRGLQSGVEAIPLAHQADMAQAANAWVVDHQQTPSQEDIPSLEALLIEVYKQGREYAQRATNLRPELSEAQRNPDRDHIFAKGAAYGRDQVMHLLDRRPETTKVSRCSGYADTIGGGSQVRCGDVEGHEGGHRPRRVGEWEEERSASVVLEQIATHPECPKAIYNIIADALRWARKHEVAR